MIVVTVEDGAPKASVVRYSNWVPVAGRLVPFVPSVTTREPITAPGANPPIGTRGV